jgi:hypothetical protein
MNTNMTVFFSIHTILLIKKGAPAGGSNEYGFKTIKIYFKDLL